MIVTVNILPPSFFFPGESRDITMEPLTHIYADQWLCSAFPSGESDRFCAIYVGF